MAYLPSKTSNAPIIVSSVQHDKVEKVAHRKTTPDAQVIIHINLAKRDPLEVRPNRIHLALVETHSSLFDERLFGIVDRAATIAICVVYQIMIILWL